MTIDIAANRQTSGYPKREIQPFITYCELSVALNSDFVAAGATVNLHWDTIAPRPVDPEIIPHSRRRLGWCIRPGSFGGSVFGGAFLVTVSDGGGPGVATFTTRAFPLYSTQINFEDGVELPPWEITLAIRNHHLTQSVTFSGYVWMEASQ